MDIRHSDLLLLSEALGTQIRILEARVCKTREEETRILRFQRLKDDIDELILHD